MAENQKRWFVIHTYSGYEDRVKRNLEQRIKSMDTGDEIFQVVIPTEEEIEVRTKCIGCGICVTGCPNEAVRLIRRPDAEIISPPVDFKAWEQERLRNRSLI